MNFNKSNEVDSSEIRFFLTGGVGLQRTYPKPQAEWLNHKTWSEIVMYSEMSGLVLINHVKENVIINDN